MKKILLGLTLIVSAVASAQNGLENVIVEKYYVSNTADSIGSIGILPVGSVTYRVYADMRQGYKFQSVYGNIPHPLTISTTTSFFNNEDYGANTGNGIKATKANKNSVMLDSWLSVGAAADTKIGVLKDDDADASILSAATILQNADVTAGTPIKTKDGMVAGSPGTFTAVGFTTELDVFDATSQFGNTFTTSNGAWACLSGAVGPDTNNRVLLAQLTTDGKLTFELNIQIGTPSGGTEQYVAKNASGSEINMTSLTFDSSVLISVPATVSAAPTFTVYPNPAKDELTLEIVAPAISEKNHYSMYDATGKLVLKKEIGSIAGRSLEKIDLSQLPNGLYFISAAIGGKTICKKVVKN